MGPSEEMRSEIAFFDLETTCPTTTDQRCAILEFGAIIVCPRKLEVLDSYSTLVRPSDLSAISLPERTNGITPDAVLSAPTFSEIADQVYNILHRRIWAGHNILRFDCTLIREAFAEIGRPTPEPVGTIDSLHLLTQRFGRRAGDMKMATLAAYFKLGQQSHRSLEDVRMNLEVVKYCATVLFLESSFPHILTPNSWVSANVTAINPCIDSNTPTLLGQVLGDSSSSSFASPRMEENHPAYSLATATTENIVNFTPIRTTNPNVFNIVPLNDEVKMESNQLGTAMEEPKSTLQYLNIGATQPATFEGSSSSTGYLEPERVSISLINTSLVPYYTRAHRIILLYNGVIFQLCCKGLRVKYGVITSKFVDCAGRPKLNFVVYACPTLCQILDACDEKVQKLSINSGSNSVWKPVVMRKNSLFDSPTVRLQIPTINADDLRYGIEIYMKEFSGSMEKLMFTQCSAEQLCSLINPGTFMDAYFSLDPYDYQHNAGIHLVVKKLFLHSN